MMSQPEVSIVIRTYNEEKFLPALLASLKQQTYRDYETIVVDSGSFGRTREIAARDADRLIGIQSRDFTFGYSLNTGIRAAGGRYIVCVSAHTLPFNENWLTNLVAPLQDPKTAMVYGRQLGGKSTKFSETRDLRRTFGTERKILRTPDFFANNANSAFRKELWSEHHFNEDLLGLEDIEWAKYWMERQYLVVYEPKAALYHFHEENWRQVRRRYYREAVAAHWIGIKGFKHAITAPAVEATRLLLDFGHILLPSGSDIGRSKNGYESAKESILFRINKSYGTLKGLLDGGIMQNTKAREKILFNRRCRAVVVHGPCKASLKEVKIPKIKPGDVLIRVAYLGVCATDLEIYQGTLGYYKDGMAKYPIIPGHEFSGHVVATGPNVNNLRLNDSVVVECIQSCGMCTECRRKNFIGCKLRTELGVMGRDGGYTEYIAVPGHFAHKLPADYDMQKACLCEPLAVVLKGLKRFMRTWPENNAPKRCAVVGAGPLGHLCARVLSLWGHRPTVFDRNPVRREYFSGSGIDVSDDLSLLNEFEYLIEVTGDPKALDTMLHQSPAGASILLLGLPYAHRNFTFENIVAFDKMVVGSVGSSSNHFRKAIRLLPQIDTKFFSEKVLDLSEFNKAWELVQSQKYLKVILKAG
jgi:2-desacetyl-2-hydroxyethyl bacteriochlorophyllide A dehydrogenase